MTTTSLESISSYRLLSTFYRYRLHMYRKPNNSGSRWIWLTILTIGVFYFATIRSGHAWGDDFAMYIRHAINLSNGTPYDETGVIRNPWNFLGPVAYPPVFPLLLAPVYKLWGVRLTVM